MSLLTTIAKGFAGGGITGAIAGGAAEIFGGLGGENIAKNLSKQLGCQIPQANAAAARSFVAKGINPCTMQPIAGYQPPQPIPVYEPSGPYGPPAVGGGMVGNGGGMVLSGSAGGALEFTTTGLVRNVIVAGKRISRRVAAAFIRKHGFEIAATAFGLSMQQLAKVVLDDSSRKRRRKGLTYKQITQAKRVIRTVKSMSSSLGCSTTRRAPARRSSRASASCR